MFKRTVMIALAAAAIGYIAMPTTAEAAGYKNSRSSGYSSSSRGFGRSGPYTRPKAVAPSRTPYTRPSIPRSSNAAPYRRPAATPSRGSTPYNNRSTYRAPARQVSSPMTRNTTINRNYYGSNRGYGGGYNRGNYGGNYGGGMSGGGMGMGSAILAGAGGAILGNMIYNGFSNHTPSGGTTRTTESVQQIQQEQRIEDKLDQVNDKLDAQQAPQVAPAGPQGYSLPADAPLMMSPSFYQLGGGM